MRIAVLSCFPPYRGGISQFNANLLAGLGKCDDVKAFNFKRQYPAILFPGKTQYVADGATPVGADAILDTVNPLSWIKTARAIGKWGPDLLVLPYWMSWFAPSLGWTGRHVKAKRIGLIHNAIPHEPHWFDRPLARYFLGCCDGLVCLSGSVEKDLEGLGCKVPVLNRPHPLYDHFGEKLPRDTAASELGLDPRKKTLLFFGLIREYKGLDILLEAFRDLPEDYQLLVAGEPYGSFEKYRAIIDDMPGKERVHLFLEYIPDSRVTTFFSASDLAVLPYRSATQSGINAIACHFDLPMVVTGVGGLRESVGLAGTGIVAASPAPSAIREEILRFFSSPGLRQSCIAAIGREKERLGWDRFCKDFTHFAATLNTNR